MNRAVQPYRYPLVLRWIHWLSLLLIVIAYVTSESAEELEKSAGGTMNWHVLAGLGLTRSVDFRGLVESAAQSYALPQVRYHALPIEPTVVQRAKELAVAGQQITAPVAVGLMQDTYRAFVSDNAQPFAGLFEQLLAEDSPLVFHCTAGKDRTGFAAALILLALGVSREVVMQDYLLTNALYRRPAGLVSSAPQEVLNVIWRVQEDFLEAALQAVDQDHGGV